MNTSPIRADRPGLRRRIAGLAACAAALLLAACGGGGGGDGFSGGGGGGAAATVSGTITYDRVPFSTTSDSLNFAAATQAPARSVVVELLSSTGSVLATTVTDANGNYTFNSTSGTSVQLRVRAKLTEAGSAPKYTVTVVDNTSGNAPYVFTGATFTVTAPTTTRSVNFASGWNGTAYVDANRAAAPFALLDTIYRGIQLIRGANANAQFAELKVHWSTRNFPSDTFNPSTGAITTSFFLPVDSGSGANLVEAGMYVLGDAATDTDEFDEGVIAHEYGHYYESAFGRSESIGGNHSLGDKLDFRVAFSEGWGNAFSGMVRNNSLYKDSGRPGTTQGFSFDVEDNTTDSSATPPSVGWYSESTVQEILWDAFDSGNAEGNDTVALGFAPIHTVMTGNFRNTPALATLFPFLAELKAANAGSATGIDTLGNTNGVAMAGIDAWGTTETNNAGRADILPVYRLLQPGQGTVVVQSTNNIYNDGLPALYNALGNRRFFRLTIPNGGQVSIRVAGNAGADPDLYLYRGVQGMVEFGGCPGATTSTGTTCANQQVEIEQWSKNLAAGEYVLEVLDFNRIDDSVTPAPAVGDSPISVTVTQP